MGATRLVNTMPNMCNKYSSMVTALKMCCHCIHSYIALIELGAAGLTAGH